jgi:hypothetical protein
METPVNYQKITKFPIHSKMLGLRLVKGPKIGASNTYRLDPSFAFRGRDKQFLEQVRKEVKHLKIIK